VQADNERLCALIHSLDGFHSGPVRRAAYDADFHRLCPSSTEYVPIDIFLNHCSGVLGLTFKGGSNTGSSLARCAYDSCLMMTQTRGMCKQVYLIFRAAFTAFESSRDATTILLWIRLRTVFLMYANEHQQLPYTSAKKLVDDLALTSEHLQPIYNILRLEPDMPPWNWEAFSNRDILGNRFSACRLPRSGGSNLKPAALATNSNGVSFAHECRKYSEFPLNCRRSSWKGKLVDEEHAGYKFAATILMNAKRMYPPESPWLDRVDWESTAVDDGFRTFTRGCPLAYLTSLRSMDDFMDSFDDLASEAKRIVAAQPIVARLLAPCKVYGDIQGGFRELLLLFHEIGFPSDLGGDIETCTYVFNGNFVDVGLHQIEVLCLLFALKVLYPSRIWLIRGNHEFRHQNVGEFGLQTCCEKMFLDSDDGIRIFDAAHSVFDWLPIAAVIAGSIFVCHGGVSHENGQWHLEELLLLDKYRPIQTWTHKSFPNILLQLLWSNPDDAQEDSNRSVCNHVWQKERQVGIKRPVNFTQTDTNAFMERNSIQLIIRSHQVPTAGASFHHKGKILTVFSSKNYNGICANAGAVALVCLDEEGDISCRIKTSSRTAAAP
jgi:hypothetical protein